jgi:hypothetical protein
MVYSLTHRRAIERAQWEALRVIYIPVILLKQLFRA